MLKLVFSLIALLPATRTLLAAEPITNSLGMKLVPIAAGSFVMGQDGPTSDYFFTKHPEETKLADFDERSAHRVTISQAFHLGATEVTVGQYRQFQPGHQKRAADDEAVTEVSWHEAMAFCAWLSKKEGRTYRLPTEAEWEYACRAGTTTLFSSGDALPAGSQKWFREDNWRPLFFPEGKAMPPEYRVINQAPSLQVAQTPPNAWGLHDMHGNVAEWCLDWHGPYEAGDQTDPLGRSDGDFRVFRGGAHSLLSYMLRSANRSAWIPESRSPRTGFRVVLGELPKGKTLPPAAEPLNAQRVSHSVPKIEAQAENVPSPAPMVAASSISAPPWPNPAATSPPRKPATAAFSSSAVAITTSSISPG